MKKITFLLPCAAAIAFSGQAFAQESLEEVVVTASPLGKTADQISGSVNILNEDDLRQSASTNLGETLGDQLGVASSSFGPGVGVPVIRGQSGKRVAVLQNGSALGDVSDTSADHAVATNPLLASQIEVLRGPATLRHGSGAIGGVVNVLDQRIHSETLEGVTGAVQGAYDSNGDATDLAAKLDLGVDQWVFHLDAAQSDSDDVEISGLADHEADDPDETTDGYIENSDYEVTSYGAGLSWVGEDTLFGLSVSQLENNYGVPAGAHEHSHEEDHEDEDHEDEDHEDEDHEDEDHDHEEEEEVVRIDLEQTQWQAKFAQTNLSGFFDSVTLDLGYSDYEHVELEFEDGEALVGTQFSNTTTELQAELVHGEVANWRGAFGLQTEQRDFEAVGEEAFVPASDTSLVGLYVIEEYQAGRNILELGARVDQQTISSAGIDDLDDTSVSVNASLLVPVGDQQTFGFNLSRSERAPVSEEYLSDGEHIATGTYEIGDTDLDNERALNAEISYRYSGPVDFQVSAYYNAFSNYIYQYDTELLFNHDLEEDGLSGLDACSTEDGFDHEEEAEEASECFVWQQQGADFTGIEAELEWSVDDNNSFRLWGDTVRAELDDGTDVPRMPPARVGLQWFYNATAFSSSLSVLKAADQDRPGENQEETEGYTRVDAYLEYRATENARLFFRGRNLTDEEIRNSTSFLREVAPEAGRSLTLGVTYSF